MVYIKLVITFFIIFDFISEPIGCIYENTHEPFGIEIQNDFNRQKLEYIKNECNIIIIHAFGI